MSDSFHGRNAVAPKVWLYIPQGLLVSEVQKRTIIENYPQVTEAQFRLAPPPPMEMNRALLKHLDRLKRPAGLWIEKNPFATHLKIVEGN